MMRIRPTRAILTSALALLIALSGCQSDVETTAAPPPLEDEVQKSDYTGPAPRNPNVQEFKTTVWEALRGRDRCGGCHDKNETPYFVASHDVNVAYDAIGPFVDFTTPSKSAIVNKVYNGHNCWYKNNNALCREDINNYLDEWLYPDNGAPVEKSKIVLAPMDEASLTPPNTDFISFPSDPTSFANTVWPILTARCAGCHADTATIPQVPFISQSDLITAYDATRAKIDLNDPPNSRLYIRLKDEFHNCWSDAPTDTCDTNAAEILTAIQALATSADSGGGSTLDLTKMVHSKSFNIPQATSASGGGRNETHLIAAYKFDSGDGDKIHDKIIDGGQANLDLLGTQDIDYRWMGNWGIEFLSPRGSARASVADSKKIYDAIKISGEYSIEAWLVPGNVTQDGPARIVSYSAGNDDRNFTLGQTLYNYDFLARSTNTDANGAPAVSTPNDREILQSTLQHVVLTYDAFNGRRIYVNGELITAPDDQAQGSLTNWEPGFALILGNEASGQHPWAGTIRFLGIHRQALNQVQVQQNFDASVGQRFYLLFNVSSVVELPQSYILFSVEQFDNYSYLFASPTFIRLGNDDNPVQASDIPSAGITLEGMRIGINGKEASIGQAYTKLRTTITQSGYSVDGQLLTERGTIIALEKGPLLDEFFLTFDNLNDKTDTRIKASITTSFPAISGSPQPDIGLRTFDEINTSMARITGVSPNLTYDDSSGPKETFLRIKQQLPGNEDINGFVSAHQIGIAQLAIEYCNALVEDASLRTDWFPNFDFTANAESVADADWETQVVTPLVNRIMGTNLNSQPSQFDATSVLMSLITLDDEPRSDDPNVPDPVDGIPEGLAKCGNTCSADHTRTVVKASCAALLGSAILLVQ